MIYSLEKEKSVDGKKPLMVLIKIGLILLLTSGLQEPLSAQVAEKVSKFDVSGLRLNMNLDYVIKQFNINNIKVNKDAYGIVNGYEIKKRINRKKVMVLLSFTGEKRLYRIHYSKLNDKYRYHSKDLFAILVNKYGTPWKDNVDPDDQRSKNITACWGSSCNKYPRTTPILTARIHHSSGRLELMLSDNRIFNKDWKLYKQKLMSQMADKNKSPSVNKGDESDF